MKKPLVSVLLSGAMLLTAGVAGSWAGTITFTNSSINPDGAMTLDGFQINATCGLTDDVLDCMNPMTGPFVGPVITTGADDYLDRGGAVDTFTGDSNAGVILQYYNICQTGMPCMGNPAAMLTTGTFDSVVSAALSEPAPTPDGNDLVIGLSEPSSSNLSDPEAGNTTPLEIAAPGLAEVPESGALILVGLGLVAGAKYLRRRKLA